MFQDLLASFEVAYKINPLLLYTIVILDWGLDTSFSPPPSPVAGDPSQVSDGSDLQADTPSVDGDGKSHFIFVIKIVTFFLSIWKIIYYQLKMSYNANPCGPPILM